MTAEEHRALVQELLTEHGNQAKVSLIVSQLSEDYTGVLAETQTANDRAKELEKYNNDLRDANSKLCLKITDFPSDKKEEDKKKEKEEETPTFDALFDENGNLK